MADTLVSVTQEELDDAKLERTRAQGALTEAEGDLVKAEEDLAEATATLTGHLDAMASIRREIAETSNKAAGTQLYADLEVATILARGAQALVAEEQERVGELKLRAGARRSEVERTGVVVERAERELKAAKELDETLVDWRDAATSNPLQGLPAKADRSTGTAKTAHDKAEAKLKKHVGDKLFARVKSRREKRHARLTALVVSATGADQALAAEAAKVSLSAKRVQEGIAFEAWRLALREFVLTGQERYDQALALLGKVGSVADPTASEKARIDALTATADAANAFALEDARDVAREALETAKRQIDEKRVAALAKDPAADPDKDAAVDTLLKSLKGANGLEKALEKAQDDLDKPVGATPKPRVKDTLDALELAVPDAVWALFEDYWQACELLDALKAVVPATVASATPEDNYAKALRAEREAAARVAAVGELVSVIDGRAAAAAETRPARLFEALRGDA
jgi:hypothetical protein